MPLSILLALAAIGCVCTILFEAGSSFHLGAHSSAFLSVKTRKVASDTDELKVLDVLGGLALLLGLACAAQPALNVLVKYVLMRIDRDIWSVDIDMDRVVVDLSDRSLVIHQLHVFNPEGYLSEYMIKAEKVKLSFDILTFVKTRGKVLPIKSLQVEDCELICELRDFGGFTNLQKVDNHAKGLAVASSGKLVKIRQTRETRVHEFKVTRIRVHVRMPEPLPHGPEIGLEDINIRDLYGDAKCELVTDVSALIIRTLTAQATSATGSIISAAQRTIAGAKAVTAKVDGLVAQVTELGHQVQETFESAKVNLTSVAHTVEQKVEKLFKHSAVHTEASNEASLVRRSDSEKASRALICLRKALLQTGLQPAVLLGRKSEGDKLGLTRAHLEKLCNLTAAVETQECSVEELFEMLSQGREVVPLAEFHDWLQNPPGHSSPSLSDATS